eukprot:CAMPEP_0181459954 /NCGR_PEP_ID=MMETSP1110-20121109/33092_1 /TAXON_ID=174948 /ORGANISM="Symbiodinium sp., Strain CCMP421" /LENGTH=120 /DNA_ID=CAMNT_0023584491 /DNA_START=58 /DNA_END=421 /DNA_ORIENTATION=+
MWRILLPALLAAAYASPEALVADDEANALGLLQHKGEKTATEMMSAELAVNMSQPGLAFLEDGEARFGAASSTARTLTGTSAAARAWVLCAADQAPAARAAAAWPCACEGTSRTARATAT